MIVVDSSALVDVLVGGQPHPDLLDLVATQELHAPALLDFEVASALRGHVLAGKLSERRLGEALADFTALHIERYLMTEYLRSVVALRENLTVYDAAYVVLAQALLAPIVTADAKLLEVSRLGIDVQVIRS
ncbi:MAG: type II toxin-antitoxin system VapC family toxin [Angustibacter sp.]